MQLYRLSGGAVVVVAGVGTNKARRKGVGRTRMLVAHSCLAQYLVSAHQEEVHSSPIDAMPLTQSRQDLFDGKPGLYSNHTGCPIWEVDTAVFGSLISL